MKKKILVSFLLLVVLAVFAYRCHVLDRPFFAVAICSCSMEPIISRGDVVFIRNVRDDTNLNIGQIILFKAEDEEDCSWILHRIVGGNNREGYITQGDNNVSTDQVGFGFSLIKPEWIGGIVPEIGSKPIKIPKLGYVTLMIDEKLDVCPFVTGMLINVAFFMLLLISFKTIRFVGKHSRIRKIPG